MTVKNSPTTMILFGATGDLTRLKLLPALRELWISGQLPKDFKLVAVGRREMTTKDFTDYLANIAVHPFTHDLSMLNLEYLHLEFTGEDGFKPLRELMHKQKGHQFLFYMAVGPDVLELSIDEFSHPEFRGAIAKTRSVIVAEKPFGENLANAHDLSRKLNSIFGVRNIFRNDHYLNKDTVEAIIPIRQTDPEMQKLLTKEELAEVQVIVSENVDLGTRAGYFDCRGMLMDWVQSHMLQMLAVLCADLDSDNFNLSKADFISSLELQPHSLIRAQYEGYKDMPGVDDACETETFFAGQFTSHLPQWQGVTFSLIAGKAMADKAVLINLRLKHPHPKLGHVISLHIDPAGGHALLNKLSGDEYQDTIMNAIHDRWERFVSQQEVEAQWQIVEKIRQELRESRLEYYAKGTAYEHFCTDTWCIAV